MIRSPKGFFLAILFLLISCRAGEPTLNNTPTPFGSTPILPRVPAVEPIPISLSNLAANPEFFEGSTLQLAGEYQLLPKLVCSRDPHPSPATWGIVGEGLLANAAGYDTQLRSLLAKNQPITVEGHWLRYNGPIGCGKSATVQEIWYLSVNRIIEPYPLARVPNQQAAQGAGSTTIAALPETPNVPTQEFNETPTNIPLEQATESILIATTTIPTEASLNATSTLDPALTTTLPLTISLTPDPTIQSTITPVFTGTFTPTPDKNVTATQASTPGNETNTPGPTGTSTPQSQGQNFNDKGSIDYEDLKIGTLQAGKPDQWTLAVDTADSITVTVAPASNANILITIIDENGAKIVDAHNLSAGGQVETIKELSITTPGLYEIYIDTEPAVETHYALMAMNSDSYSFAFMGTLVPSSPKNDTLVPDNDHFWFFPLSVGNKINLRVTPNGQADPYLELYDPQGSRILTIDDSGTGETEVLENYEALLNGMYSIRVGEFDFAAMSYEILLTNQ